MDQTKRPLHIPPEFAMYAEKHGLFDMYKQLIEQLIINRPEDPIAFLVDLLNRDTLDVPQIMILGPPAAGKRSISKMVATKLRCTHLTPENLVQEADPKLRDQIEDLMAKKATVPTEMWVSALKERMKMFDCVKKGWVLEGFPQTREQALALQELGIYPKHCVVLDAPDTVLIERAAGKRVDPKTGDVYHTTFEWPSSAEIQGRLEEGKGQNEPEMVEKLVEYHRHSDAIGRCFASSIKVINADQPKADVFSQALAFLQSQPRSNSPQTPRIVLLGPTGSGKGVQASLLANKYNIVKVSCGQLIKQAITQETKAGLAAKPYVEKDRMMPDGIVLNILKERLCQLDCQTRGWVLSGYPRTREQAEQLGKAGLAPNRVFFLEVPNDSVIERLTQRATDPVTGERYHMLYNPPPTQEVKARLDRHPQDQEEAVRKRLAQYHAYVEEISDYYLDAQHVIADQDPHTVFECLESMTVKPLPKRY
ncbi:adenylate kinase 8-like [Littorina saxatilis]|uniref:Adenylate kinase n=1 Tax=Littorina saxatilis TaxID=31220 RepID=A0AAN9G5U0_9CAEN